MTELQGFNPVSKLGPELGPQALRIPSTWQDAIDEASAMLASLGAMIVGDGQTGLAARITIELRPRYAEDGTITPWAAVTPWSFDAVSNYGAANPGDWIAIDGSHPESMTQNQYASMFTENVPLVWAATTVAPTATLNDDDGSVTLAFPQPTSANRPFTYSLSGPGTAGDFTIDADGNVSVTVTNIVPLLGADSLSWTVHCTTQYSGVDADSLASNVVTVPTPEL